MTDIMLLINLALPFLLSFAITASLGTKLIPWLHKLKFGQEIREEGPSWHQKKSGTPTMGGIMFIIGIVVSAVISFAIIMTYDYTAEHTIETLIILLAGVGFGAIGFIDDYIKVIKKRNLGLTSAQKAILQLVMAVLFLLAMTANGSIDYTIIIPFTKFAWTMPVWLYWVFALFVIVGTVNAVNLTDGLDGLATSVTIVVGAFFVAASIALSHLGCYFLSASLIGGLLGFLIYNKYPAKVFMGDTGSLFLGGLVAAMAIGMDMPIFIIIAGFVYFMETLSVIIQVTSFKLTGKRVFKMSPIHHHFEMCGWSEKKIVAVFSAVTLILCIAAFCGIRI